MYSRIPLAGRPTSTSSRLTSCRQLSKGSIWPLVSHSNASRAQAEPSTRPTRCGKQPQPQQMWNTKQVKRQRCARKGTVAMLPWDGHSSSANTSEALSAKVQSWRTNSFLPNCSSWGFAPRLPTASTQHTAVLSPLCRQQSFLGSSPVLQHSPALSCAAMGWRWSALISCPYQNKAY